MEKARPLRLSAALLRWLPGLWLVAVVTAGAYGLRSLPMLGVAMPLTTLIAAGTAVCGALAIAGVNGTLRAEDEDVTYAVAVITLFGMCRAARLKV